MCLHSCVNFKWVLSANPRPIFSIKNKNVYNTTRVVEWYYILRATHVDAEGSKLNKSIWTICYLKFSSCMTGI